MDWAPSSSSFSGFIQFILLKKTPYSLQWRSHLARSGAKDCGYLFPWALPLSPPPSWCWVLVRLVLVHFNKDVPVYRRIIPRRHPSTDCAWTGEPTDEFQPYIVPCHRGRPSTWPLFSVTAPLLHWSHCGTVHLGGCATSRESKSRGQDSKGHSCCCVVVVLRLLFLMSSSSCRYVWAVVGLRRVST